MNNNTNKLKIKTSDIIFIILLLIVINTFIFIKMFSKRAELLLLDYTSFKLTNTINAIIDKALKEVIYNQKKESFLIDYKNTDNSIENIDFNSKELNNIFYLINENILNSIISLKDNNNNDFCSQGVTSNERIFYIPLGVIYNTPILNNFGPKIPFKVDIIGSVNNEEKINIKEYGINSSLIELLLNISIQLKIVLPFKSKNIVVKKSIILDSKIVQGEVPNYYGGLVGVH